MLQRAEQQKISNKSTITLELYIKQPVDSGILTITFQLYNYSHNLIKLPF